MCIKIDILIGTKDGIIIAGKAKWKNSKVCKNVFLLELKDFEELY